MLPINTRARRCPVVDFNAIAGKAGELLNEHGDQVEAAAEKVGEMVKDKYGHDEQVDMAVDKIKDLIPGGESPGAAPAGH
jgi:MT0933-like antitoxin protein